MLDLFWVVLDELLHTVITEQRRLVLLQKLVQFLLVPLHKINDGLQNVRLILLQIGLYLRFKIIRRLLEE